MNRRGLFRMLGLAPMAAVAAVLPQPAHGFAVGTLGAEMFWPGVVPRRDVRWLVDSLEVRIDKFDREMGLATSEINKRFLKADAQLSYWGA